MYSWCEILKETVAGTVSEGKTFCKCVEMSFQKGKDQEIKKQTQINSNEFDFLGWKSSQSFHSSSFCWSSKLIRKHPVSCPTDHQNIYHSQDFRLNPVNCIRSLGMGHTEVADSTEPTKATYTEILLIDLSRYEHQSFI